MIGSPKYDVKGASVIDNDTDYCFLPGIRKKNGYQYTTHEYLLYGPKYDHGQNYFRAPQFRYEPGLLT